MESAKVVAAIVDIESSEFFVLEFTENNGNIDHPVKQPVPIL
jgi:hypothetical protein